MIKQIELPITIKLVEPIESTQATIKDFNCPDNKELFLWHISQGVKESGNTKRVQ